MSLANQDETISKIREILRDWYGVDGTGTAEEIYANVILPNLTAEPAAPAMAPVHLATPMRVVGFESPRGYRDGYWETRWPEPRS